MMFKSVLAAGAALAIGLTASASSKAADSFTIGLSNGWVGSEWRTQMIDEAEAAAKAWKAKGVTVKTNRSERDGRRSGADRPAAQLHQSRASTPC